MIRIKSLAKQLNLYAWLCISGIALFIGNEKIMAASTVNEKMTYMPKKIKEICALAQNISAPVLSMQNDVNHESYKCDAYALYFGFGESPDYVKAKKCALLNNRYDVLSMIYANGKGVNADFNLAIHYACMMNAAPAEMELRITHLDTLRQKKSFQEDFNICDDICESKV